MKLLYLLLLTLSISVNALAQTINGKIVDVKKLPIPNATVIVLSQSDSSFVASTTSKEDGTFSLSQLSYDKAVCLKISSIGYKTVIIPVSRSTMGNIELKEDSKILKDVNIVGHRIVNDANGYNLALKNTGLENCNSIQDVFAFLPSISIEKNKINLLGKQPIIYVDGIKLTSQDELKALSPKRIDRIEVNYLSLGEGANAMGGTIKITTKKEVDGGFSGYLQESISEMLSYGHVYDSPTFVFDASCGHLTVNYYAYYSHQKLLEDAKNKYSYKMGEDVSYISNTRSWSNVFSNRLNLSYEVSTKSTLALSEYLENTDVKNNQYNDDMHIYGPEHQFLQQTVLKYILKLDNKGSNFEITADYLGNKHHQTQGERTNEKELPTSYLSQNTNMYCIAPKLVKKNKLGNEMDLGLDYQYIHSKDKTENQLNRMTGYSPSVYMNYSGKFKAFMYSLGLTWEFNHMEVISNGVESSSNVNCFCPQTNLMWMLNQKKNTMLMLMYKESVENMPYSVLSAFRNYDTPNHYTTGNTSLSIPRDHQLMFRFDLNSHLAFMMMYERILDDIYFDHGIDEQNPSLTWSRPENANYTQAIGARVEYTFSPVKWWKTKLQGAVQQIRFSSYEQTLTGKCCGKFWFNNNFNFSETFGASCKAYWETGTSFENYSWRPVGNFDVSLWKSACKEKLRFALDATICARGRKIRTKGDGYTSFYTNTTKPSSFDFTITWNFNGGKDVRQRTEAKSIQEFHTIKEQK